ncbi:MAG: LytTR family DNA-binding domain-containing protein [Gemmatimonadaceae bacterium]
MRVLIVDDEAPARRKLRRFLAAESDTDVVSEAADGREAVEAIRAERPDLVFLDIQMPGLDGFGVIGEIGVREMPTVVFVTAYDEHALRAFEVHALDYLLKPVAPDRFRTVLERARARVHVGQKEPGELAARVTQLAQLVEQLRESVPGAAPRYLQRLLVEAGEKAILLSVERIDWVEAARNYVRLHAGRDSYTVRGAIGAFHARLDPSQFLRVNRSQIVRLDAVKELHPWFHGEYLVVLHDGTRLTWSRRFRKAGEAEFEQPF